MERGKDGKIFDEAQGRQKFCDATQLPARRKRAGVEIGCAEMR